MIQDDWILRMIQAAVVALARLRSGEQTPDQAVPGALLAVTGLGEKVRDRMPAELLFDMLCAGVEGPSKALVTGALLAHQATTTHRKEQALTLLTGAGVEVEVPEVETAALIERLLNEVSPGSIPPRLHRRLFLWFVHHGELDRADDYLHAAGPLPGLRAEARGVLEPLRGWSPRRLAAGGWSRTELEDVLRELDG
ncbi:MAG: hypothetical protein ACI8PZ_005271 [Myxococcota bacterium]|jgi:hypothetical protein